MLVDVLGKNPEVRILDHFLLHEDFEYTKSEIAKYAGISRATVYEKLPTMLSNGMLVESKKIGNIILYRLNLKNPVVKELRTLNFQIARNMAEVEYTKHSTEKIPASTALAAPS
ncbi:MAG: winged helix-turn-helix domain-containing protein [Candidatus Thermoplasmatota archaeon]|nr:winged helix-turn-helix domain-containing protein [Candidatus Thermoplasmatota archaeon]MBU4256014.1 winged helix-turn-helix domain-containing protein [Candidatus Thermoplasmatota archaeon]MCG2825601.1 winged helix-turn-helix domain-containing protein [Thermoplasmatales archaeon]